MRDNAGASRGFGFVNYDSFEASDAAIDAMNNQFLCNRPITVTYAFKKDTKGERHGSAAGAPPPARVVADVVRHGLDPWVLRADEAPTRLSPLPARALRHLLHSRLFRDG
jgi:splicing factor 3B subunit 4